MPAMQSQQYAGLRPLTHPGTTDAPVYVENNLVPVRMSEQERPMDHNDKQRLRVAAAKAIRDYPGPVGDVLSREILSWEEFGYRLGGDSLVRKLVDFVMRPKQDTA